MREFRNITIIGVGLLGGSIGLAAKARWKSIRVAGVGRRAASLDAALQIGAIDSAHLDAAAAVAGRDLVILATPVMAFEKHLRAIVPVLEPSAIVTDVGSTKAYVTRIADRVLGPGRFVGSHPMAGSDQRGPQHAKLDLLAGATCVVTPTRGTAPANMERVEDFWRELGMKVVRLSPAAHDRAVAKVSHLPHALAGLLMLLPSDEDMAVAATGMKDMTRLAGGDVEMWRDIFLSNRGPLLAAIDRLDKSLATLRVLVDTGDAKGIERLLDTACRRRMKHFNNSEQT